MAALGMPALGMSALGMSALGMSALGMSALGTGGVGTGSVDTGNVGTGNVGTEARLNWLIHDAMIRHDFGLGGGPQTNRPKMTHRSLPPCVFRSMECQNGNSDLLSQRQNRRHETLVIFEF